MNSFKSCGSFVLDKFSVIGISLLAGFFHNTGQIISASLLMHSFLREFNLENEKNIKSFDNRSKSAILKYNWPGNIRELRNCIESAVVMCSGEEIKIDDLPAKIRENSEAVSINIPVGVTMEEAEKIIIQENLAFCNGNKSKCAEILGIGRKTLHRKLEELNIEE